MRELNGFIYVRERRPRMHSFHSKHILIFEDGFFLSDEVSQKLQSLGAVIIGPVHSTADALYHLESGVIDAAILDVAIEPAAVLSLVEALEKSRTPFVFALAANPSMSNSGCAGFVLSQHDDDLVVIAEALFRQRPMLH
ncbi:transcriptional regulator [Ochrobactrum vermis]|uniref:Transcriptional regulator n=1 Tax=Ochrobactrum vermis TaxID=1827297 RepID=A0ABU8PLW4_9HYPH|nr:transcriptional regulator [Ochrobactrum vermis]